MKLRLFRTKILRMLILIFFFLFSAANFYSQTEYSIYIPNGSVTGIDVRHDEVWVSTYGKGIFKIDKADSSIAEFSSAKGNLENDFFYCIAASKDFIWAGTSDGLYTFDRKRNLWRKRKFAAGGEYGNWIRSLCFDEKENVLWIGRFVNLTRFDIAQNKFEDFDLTFNNDSKTNNFQTIKIENNRYVWFGTEGGVYRYNKSLPITDKTSLEFFHNKGNGFRGEGDAVSVSDIFFDKNWIWFATDEFITAELPEFNIGGLYRFNRRASWEKFDKRTGLSANGINALARIGDKIWIALYEFNLKTKSEIGKGLIMVDVNSGKPQSVNMEEIKLTTNKISALNFDGDDLWIGSDAGLWQVKFRNKFTLVKNK